MERKFVLIKLDETEYWEKGTVLAKVGRIFGLYVADLSSRTHCCELTPSYELNFIHSQCEHIDGVKEEEWEAIDDYLMSGDAESPLVQYMHCSTVDAFPILDSQKGQCFPPDGKSSAIIELGDFDEDDTIDDVMEYVHANGF